MARAISRADPRSGGDSVRVTRTIVAALLVSTLSGCVDGTARLTVLPDGSGSIALDLGYEVAQWPPMFGDPLEGFRTPDQLARFTDPGFVAWSRPRIVEADGERRWRSEVFFDDIGAVRFLGRQDGRTIEALGFDAGLDRGRIGLRPGFLVYLDDPLPLPSPRRIGMTGVSLSDDLLAAIRQRIRPVIEGLDVSLEVVLPGRITRADGLDGFSGRTARLHVDADRLAAAFMGKARVLTDVEALRDDPTWAWELPPQWDQVAAEDLRRRRAEALEWWGE